MPIGLNQVSNLGLSENLLRQQVWQQLSSHPTLIGMPGITGAQRMITTSIQLSPYDEVESIMALCQVGLRLKLPGWSCKMVLSWIGRWWEAKGRGWERCGYGCFGSRLNILACLCGCCRLSVRCLVFMYVSGASICIHFLSLLVCLGWFGKGSIVLTMYLHACLLQ